MANKSTYAVSLIIIILILTGIAMSIHYTPKPVSTPTTRSSSNPGTYVPRPPAQQVIITASEEDYSRFEQIMPKTDLVQDIPKEGKIMMSFFNFNSGEREWERDYILNKGSISQGHSDDVDIKLILHSRNLPKLNENNVCQIFQQAKAQGDFGSELIISKVKFTWKYKGMMGYKSCLGF